MAWARWAPSPRCAIPSSSSNTFRFDDRLEERAKRFDEAKTGIGGHLREDAPGRRRLHLVPRGAQGGPTPAPEGVPGMLADSFPGGMPASLRLLRSGRHSRHNGERRGVPAPPRQADRAPPWQLTYLLEDDADVPCLEPELGCLGPIIEYFGTLQDRYLRSTPRAGTWTGCSP